MPIYKWSKVAASNGNSDPTINYLEGQAPSSINDSARAAMAAEAKFRDDISGTLTTTGSSTAYALTTNSVFDTAALMSGAMITFIPHATSGASPTLAVDGLTARAINQSTGVAVPTGALILGTPYVCTYIHASTEFIIQGMLGAATFQDPLQVTSTTAGAGVGPTLDIYRNKTGVASDFIGALQLSGKDASGNKETYIRILTQIIDATNGSEDGIFYLQQMVAGTLTTMLQSSASGLTVSGTLGVTGAAAVTGDVAVNTNKFNVTAVSGNTTVAGTLGVTSDVAVNTNKLTVTASNGNLASAGSILSSSASGGVGYSTGAGGTVVQATNKSTGVTLNTMCGTVTTNAAALASGNVVSFIVTNAAVVATDFVMAYHVSGGSVGLYTISTNCGAGVFGVTIRNASAGSLSEAIVIQFAVFKGVTS